MSARTILQNRKCGKRDGGISIPEQKKNRNGKYSVRFVRGKVRMGNYAVNTSVSPEKSQEEIKKTLRKYGADRFGVMEEKNKAYVMFEYSNLLIQLTIDLPNKEEFKYTETGRERNKNSIESQLDQAIKQRWRALLLAIKAKLEAIECGISTIEKEFMAFVMMPDGQSLSEHIIPRLQEISKTGKMPKLLSYGESK